MVGGISLIMLSTVILADPLVRLIFGEEYLAAIPVFRAMTLAMIPFLRRHFPTTHLLLQPTEILFLGHHRSGGDHY